MRTKLVIGAAVAAAVAMAPPAQASVTFGSNLQGTTNFELGCGVTPPAPCDSTFSLQSLAAANQAPGGATAPSSGVIVGWALRHGGLFSSGHGTAVGTMTARLRVIRGAGGSGVGSGAGELEPLPQAPDTYHFDARLPVQAGDRIGYDLSITPSNLYLDGGVPTASATDVLGYSSLWPEGSSPSFYSSFDSAALLMSATLEDDADGDGFGDESQDACPANPQRQIAPCVSDSGGPAPPPGGGGTPAFGTQTLVTLKLAAGRIPATGPVKIRVANANGFATTGKLWGSSVVRSSMAARAIKLKPKAFTVAAGGSKVVKLRLPRALRRVLRRRGKLPLRLTAKVMDPAGTARTVKKRVVVKLKLSRRSG